MFSLQAENLLMGTAAVESDLGTFLTQLGGGQAFGIYQMEVRTARDIIRYVEQRSKLVELVSFPEGVWGMDYSELRRKLILDLEFATILCRLHYWRVPEPLPSDIKGLANYWKVHYNTYLGKGTVERFEWKYEELVVETPPG